MSQKTFRCGNCGADGEFTSPGTVVVVCQHCNWQSYRTDVDLKTIGEVAQPAKIASHFQIGTSGYFQDKAFTVRGQLQLDHGAGLWNEWAAEDDEGQWLWISEAQGEILFFREVEPPSKIDRDKLAPGKRVKLHDDKWTINEIGNGMVVAAAGEHPIRIATGEVTSYVDLQLGPLGIATLDYTRGDAPELMMGERVELKDLRLDPLTQPDHTPDKVSSKRIDCTHCGGAIELQDPEHAVAIGCESCGTLLDASSDKVRAIEEEQASRAQSALPLGATVTLRGETLTLLGAMERRVHADGKWWPWREYLLRTPIGAYRWLVEDNGHWQYVTPIPYAAASPEMRSGGEFKHFTSGEAEVNWVLGEFYWQVRAGEKTEARDYAGKGCTLSIESTDSEISASRGEHLERDEVLEAFDLKGGKLPRPKGVGVATPNTVRPSLDWKLFGLYFLAAIALRIFIAVNHENRVVHEGTYGPTPAVQDQQSDGQFSEEFELTAEEGNVEIQVRVPDINQGWLGVYGALVNKDTGEVTTFVTSAQYYSGSSGGENWTEGNRRGSSTLGSVPAGTYVLRIASEGFEHGLNRQFQLTVKSQVPRLTWFLMIIFLPLFVPVIATIRWWMFEVKRWSNSDHPWVEAG